MLPYQEAPDTLLGDALRARCADRMIVLLPGGQTLEGEHAVMHVYETLGYGVWVAPFRWPPLSWLARPGYALVANNRRFFSRFAFRTPE